MGRIAKELGADRKGKVAASGGYFGAMQLVADIEARLLVPAGGGRRTDPQWTERRLIPIAVRTLERLEKLTASVREHAGVNIEPMQLAALLLEKTTERLSKDDAEKLLASRRRTLAVEGDRIMTRHETRLPAVWCAPCKSWRQPAYPSETSGNARRFNP